MGVSVHRGAFAYTYGRSGCHGRLDFLTMVAVCFELCSEKMTIIKIFWINVIEGDSG